MTPKEVRSKLIWGQIHKFLRLKRREKLLIFKAFLLLGGFRLALWFLPLKTLWRVSAKRSSIDTKVKIHRFSPERIAWAITVASLYIPKATCLSQALATKVLLARYGYQSNLQIGVVKGDIGQLEAHAWVESDGKVIIGGSNLDRYSRLPSLEKGAQ
jgi:hypothetical protein